MEISGKSIVVTGGAGFIGSNLVERLAQSNKVTVVDNMHTGSKKNLDAAMATGNVKLVKADSKEIAKVAPPPDIIFHLGMYSSTPMYKKNPHLVNEVVDGAISVLEFAKEKKAKVVIASTSSIYNGHATPYREELLPKVSDFYTEGRYAVERLAELYGTLYGVDSICLRLFSVYGPHEEAKKQFANLVNQFMWSMRKGESPLIYGDGKQTRDFTYVDDTVEAFVRAVGAKGFDVFNVGTGKSHTMNELVEKLNRRMGTDIAPTYRPIDTSNYVLRTLADTTKAAKVLGFRAKTTLDEGIDKLLVL
jgi:UDP-glucose 4-epimerase